MGPSELRERALRELGSALRGAGRVALINFPNHGNPGDPGLWLGSRALLRDLGVEIGYEAAWWSLDLDSLDAAVGPGEPVLINGGGNFGDLYAGQQAARMRLIVERPGVPVIQLPQSIEFRDPANAVPVAQAIAAHGDVTLIARDERSVRAARDLLGVEARLSPDHAFGLVPLTPSVPVAREVLWMVWPAGSPEATSESQLADPPAWVHVEDWHTGAALAHESWDDAGREAWAVNRELADRWDDPRARAEWPRLRSTFPPLAERWFQRGVDLVASSRVLVTNKLHGHIVASMLGMPHVVMDNGYGKVRATLDTWTAGLPGVHVARDAAEALAIADGLRS